MSSERAGVHTSGALDREKAEAVLYEVAYQSEQLMGLINGLGPYLDRLEACVVSDPSLARIEALLDNWAGANVAVTAVRAIARGDGPAAVVSDETLPPGYYRTPEGTTEYLGWGDP